MKTKICLIAGIMGIAVISGIMQGLSSRRGAPEKEEEKRPEAELA